MNKGLKRGLVLGMSVCVVASSLAGCSSKSKGLDTTAAIATMDGTEIPAGLVNFLLRYQQAEFETNYGSFLKSYYGDDLWNADLSGSGVAYGDTFKSEIMTSLEKMLLCEQHMSDYGVELTEEETSAIKTAAADFVAANSEEVLEKMSGTEENVERILTLYTIQNKMETQMSADVDTEVSDEEAAQRTVSYVKFSPIAADAEEDTTEGDTTEGNTTEAGTEAEETEAATQTAAAEETEAVTEAAAEEETKAVTEVSTEAETATEAAVTETTATKTNSADTEAESETAVTEAATEAGTENAAEAVTESAGTEGASENAAETENTTEDATELETETETETEDAATIAAKEEARSRAAAFLETAKTAEDFAAAATEVSDADENASTSSFTFGDDDTYPDAAIITATANLEDNTLVQEVVEASDEYYVLHVDDAFDEEATATKKDEIVSQRKQDAISALYDEWMEGVEFITDEDLYATMTFDYALGVETEAATEAATEAGSEVSTETVTEAGSEVSTEAVTEAGSEVSTEAVTEAASEVSTEAITEAASEAAAAETETEAVTEA